MAAGGYKEFVAGEVLDEDDINDFLMQGVLVFAGTAARGSAITSPVEGQFAFLKDADQLTFYSGTDWEDIGVGEADFSNTATGTYTDGGTAYKYVTFTASGTVTVTKEGFADVLVVGGGGGGAGVTGGSRGAGGGGAGGHLVAERVFLPVGSLTVTVGAGGGTTTQNFTGLPGTASRLDFLYGIFGGAGSVGRPAERGGSGGGGGLSDAVASASGSGTPGQGNNGGNAISTAAAGGGGAGAVGGNGVSNTGGAGGAGTANSFTGTSVTRAGGGGGTGTTTAGAGGAGGGGAATQSGTATSGTANTGGGGGGAGFSSAGTGGNGGSGVVIVRVRT